MIKLLIYTDRPFKVQTKRQLVWLNDFIRSNDNELYSELIENVDSINDYEWDYVLIHGFNYKNIIRIKLLFKKAKLILLNPGNIIFYKPYKINLYLMKKFIEIFIDIVFVRSLVHKQVVEKIVNVKTYNIFDWEKYIVPKPKKFRKDTIIPIIGYHGNEIHFKTDFKTYGIPALKKLANELDFELHIVTSNVNYQPNIEGVIIKKFEYNVDKFYSIVDKFDIGICPIFDKEIDLKSLTTIIRNGNRAVTLLCRGIPSVISPTPQVMSDLKDNIHVKYAITEEEWYINIKELLTKKNIYENLSVNGLNHVKQYFSINHANQLIKKILTSNL